MAGKRTEVPTASETLVRNLDIRRATLDAVGELHGPELNEQNVRYLDALSDIERVAFPLDHRFVGGIVADFFRAPGFTLLIDPSTQTMHLGGNYTPPSAIRPDGTIKDADMISFNNDYNIYLTTRENLADLEANPSSPKISLEATRYYHVGTLPDSGRNPTRRNQHQEGDWPPRETGVRSLVSTLDGYIVQGETGLYMSFANPGRTLQQRISEESMQPWKLVVHGTVDGQERTWTITTLHPEALLLRYLARNPAGLKTKDMQTTSAIVDNQQVEVNKLIMLAAIAEQTRQIAADMREDGIIVPTFDEYFTSWYMFLDKFLIHQDLQTFLKTLALRIYWGTPLGEHYAHHRPDLGDSFAGGEIKKRAA